MIWDWNNDVMMRRFFSPPSSYHRLIIGFSFLTVLLEYRVKNKCVIHRKEKLGRKTDALCEAVEKLALFSYSVHQPSVILPQGEI